MSSAVPAGVAVAAAMAVSATVAAVVAAAVAAVVDLHSKVRSSRSVQRAPIGAYSRDPAGSYSPVLVHASSAECRSVTGRKLLAVKYGSTT
jgi:hypothetical protein